MPTVKTASKPTVKPTTKKAVVAANKPAGAKRAPARKPVAAPSKASAKPAASAADAAPRPAKPVGKLVRDSFTMPQQDFDLIAALKKRALVFQRPAKKSELLRAGLQVLAALDDSRLKSALEALAAIKTGRPKKI